MIKDRKQKSDALKYIISKRWFPQLELNVLPSTLTSKKPSYVTDIDVLGLMPDEINGYRKILIDCKTKKKESPINRALWLKGLMARVHSTRGICILDSTIDKDHRLMASELGIQLLAEKDFFNFSTATGGNTYTNEHSNLADIDLWDIFFEIERKYPKIQDAITFSRCNFWMIENDSEACRKTIAISLQIKAELDPKHIEHIALVGDLCALFAKSLAVISLKIFLVYMQPEQREDLANSLLMMLYGGRATYDLLNQLRKKISSTISTDDLTLPKWDIFVQLVRSILDSPVQALISPLIIREIAWSFLNQSASYDFSKLLAKEHPQAAKFALLAIEYLCRATGLPPEFKHIYTSTLMSIQSTPTFEQKSLV